MTLEKRRPAPSQRLMNRSLGVSPFKRHTKKPWPAIAQHVLCDLFLHFTTLLRTLGQSDDPETVHQARVAWRRFKGVRRLFKPLLAPDLKPPWQALQTFLTDLSRLRDLNVAHLETLPPLAEAYAAGDSRRKARWQSMMDKLACAADRQRQTVRQALQWPATGEALAATAQWLEAMGGSAAADAAGMDAKGDARRWLQRRIRRWRDAMKRAALDEGNPQTLHRCRILAKQVRYSVEALRPLLPKKRAQRWCDEATQLQTRIGALRDVQQASALLARLNVDRGLLEFLRGVAVGAAG